MKAARIIKNDVLKYLNFLAFPVRQNLINFLDAVVIYGNINASEKVSTFQKGIAKNNFGFR